jgi:hypothetical protein
LRASDFAAAAASADGLGLPISRLVSERSITPSISAVERGATYATCTSLAGEAVRELAGELSVSSSPWKREIGDEGESNGLKGEHGGSERCLRTGVLGDLHSGVIAAQNLYGS